LSAACLHGTAIALSFRAVETAPMTSLSTPDSRRELLEYLSQFVSPSRVERMEEVLGLRTRFLTVVLEDCFQPYNASACLRSCEAFGVQDVHLIENRTTFRVNRDIALGAGNWLTLARYQNGPASTAECVRSLKDRGYRIVATAPRGDAVPLEEFELTEKTALLFGTELDGLSPAALSLADGCVAISTPGFMQSLNLSVCVAVCVHHLTAKLRASALPWRLSEEEKLDLRLAWMKQTTRRWLGPLERAWRKEGSPGAGRQESGEEGPGSGGR
jgi:tRNA (guanosine-2'-O-)-methyltransferase